MKRLLIIGLIACRVEYAKAHARARRYTEEEELVLEEMNRTLKYLRWKASWWLRWEPQHQKHQVEQGRKAYSAKQSSAMMELAIKFEKSWRLILKDLDVTVDW